MPTEQWFILSILAGTLAMFLWGRWRHDMVAGGALLACVLVGLVPGAEAFSGFGHPAVITVACVLVLSRGLQLTGAVDALAQRMLPSNPGPIEAIAALTLVGAVLSAFMNNVGALALLMPIAVQLARRLEIPPGRVLMPLAFGTILGGMTTLIGTPPNLLVSGFRAENGSGSFSMFDFSAVGGVVALTGIVFIALIGWRLVPRRQQAGGDSFETSTYFTEVRVEEKSKAAGKTLEEIEAQLEEADAQIVALVRNEYRVTAPNMRQLLRAGDILIIEADPKSLSAALSGTGLQLEEAVAVDGGEGDEEAVLQEASTQESDAGNGEKEQRGKEDDEIVLQELVIMPHSAMVGRSASDVQIRTRYGLNLLAIARQGSRTIRRLRSTPVQSGDVLLMQGRPEALSAFASEISGVPLAQRSIDIPDKRKATIAMLVMAAAVAGAAFGLLPAAISFAAGMLAFMALRIVPLRSVYNSIDWTVIVLLGAMIPVAGAMADTGAADMLAGLLLEILPVAVPLRRWWFFWW